jgi:ADP-ribosylglycohydrolase
VNGQISGHGARHFITGLLEVIWIVDCLTADGEHGKRGRIGLLPHGRLGGEASDDFACNLATLFLVAEHHLSLFQTPSKNSIVQGSRAYTQFLRPFMREPERFGETLPKIDAATDENRIGLILGNRGCGAAMRATVAGFVTSGIYDLLAVLTTSHGHPDALAGAFAVVTVASHLKAKEAADGQEIIEEAVKGAKIGETLARLLAILLQTDGDSESRLACRLRRIPEMSDEDIYLEDGFDIIGTSALFVVPAAIKLLIEFMEHRSIRHVVERALEVGGDPDTLATIASSLSYCADASILKEARTVGAKRGLRFPTKVSDEVSALVASALARQ